MEKWIILQMLKPNRFKSEITELEDIAVCDMMDGHLLIFNSLDDAAEYQEEHGISGQCVELPIY
jgi:hypothetical protein